MSPLKQGRFTSSDAQEVISTVSEILICTYLAWKQKPGYRPHRGTVSGLIHTVIDSDQDTYTYLWESQFYHAGPEQTGLRAGSGTQGEWIKRGKNLRKSQPSQIVS